MSKQRASRYIFLLKKRKSLCQTGIRARSAIPWTMYNTTQKIWSSSEPAEYTPHSIFKPASQLEQRGCIPRLTDPGGHFPLWKNHSQTQIFKASHFALKKAHKFSPAPGFGGTPALLLWPQSQSVTLKKTSHPPGGRVLQGLSRGCLLCLSCHKGEFTDKRGI